MKRFRFNTIGLITRDNRAIVDFYTKVFGFTTDWDGVQPNVELMLDSMRIILFPRPDFEQMLSSKFVYPEGHNGTMELSFDVPTFSDVNKEYERALSMGAKPVLPPTTEPWGQRTCYIADPDGNLIEISSFNQYMQTDRILLRPWQETDAEALYKYASDPVVGTRAGWPPHQSVEESLEIIRTVFHNDTTWAIVLKETGEAIGAMGYMPVCELNLPAREGEPLVGYWVGKPYWNQGICTEALQLMLDYIRKETSYPSLISSHFADNPASGRVMEKCGFLPTGETAIDETLHSGANQQMRILRLELK